MAELKTKANAGNVQSFLDSIEDEKKRQDAFALLQVMREVIGGDAQMWGDSIVGFGQMRYQYSDGRVNDWFVSGFSPRKQAMSLYLMGIDTDDTLLKNLGKYSTGKSCLYVKKLSDIDIPTLKKLIQKSVDWAAKSSAD